jgi:hypothetical protein
MTPEEAKELVSVSRKLTPLTDKDHVVWAREAVRRDVKTALSRIEDPKERARLFEVLRQLLNEMKRAETAPIARPAGDTTSERVAVTVKRYTRKIAAVGYRVKGS